MNARMFVVTFGAATVLSCTSARAQDTNRVRDANQDASAVDVSVHARVGELVKQPQPSKQPSKHQTTYSGWAFQSANQSSATRFGPTQEVPDTAATAVDRPHGSTGRQLFRIMIPPLSPQSQTNGLSTQFRKKPFALPNTSSFPNPFSQTAFSSSGDRVE